jgi:hypothetical protein
MSLALRIYRRLAQAFPDEFKLAYGDEIMQLGDDVMQNIAKKHGASGLIRIIADIAIRLPIEYLSEMRQDSRHAIRALIKSPGFALVGIVSMGLGIGLTTNVYGSKWALLTRELPAAANASRLALAEKPVSYYYIEQYRDQKNLFAGVAALQTGVPFNVALHGDGNARPQRVFGQLVSPDYFSVLGVEPQYGRLLSSGLDRPGDAPVVIISDRFWRSRLHSSPDAVGQTLRLNGQTATIVGITPRNFDGALAMNPSELFVPTTVPSTLAPELANDLLHRHNAKEFLALMCLAPGVSIDAAESGLDVITRRLEADEHDPSAPPQADKAKRVVLLPAGTRAPIPRNLRHVVEAFFAVLMGLIMTIACMNLATMLLARGASRRKELAIRLGIGASRFRLIRQMISEGMVLSLLGGVAGFALAYGLSILNSHLPQAAGAPLVSAGNFILNHGVVGPFLACCWEEGTRQQERERNDRAEHAGHGTSAAGFRLPSPGPISELTIRIMLYVHYLIFRGARRYPRHEISVLTRWADGSTIFSRTRTETQRVTGRETGNIRENRGGGNASWSYPRQSPISFKPRPRACSKRRTRWRECSNSWMSAQTSACQPFSWAADSPQVAQRVCRVTGRASTPTGVAPGSSTKMQRTSSISSFSPSMCS